MAVNNESAEAASAAYVNNNSEYYTGISNVTTNQHSSSAAAHRSPRPQSMHAPLRRPPTTHVHTRPAARRSSSAATSTVMTRPHSEVQPHHTMSRVADITDQNLRRRLPHLDLHQVADQIGENELLELLSDTILRTGTITDCDVVDDGDGDDDVFVSISSSTGTGTITRTSTFNDSTGAESSDGTDGTSAIRSRPTSMAALGDYLHITEHRDGSTATGATTMRRRRFAKEVEKLKELVTKQTLLREQIAAKPTKKPVGFARWKLERKKSFYNAKARVHDWIIDSEIWKEAFKKIEGRFGSSVVSYFRFLKWLLLLNAVIAVVLVLLVVIPQVVLGEKEFTSSHMTSSDEQVLSVYQNQSLVCSEEYLLQLHKITTNQSVTDLVLHFFQGTGWMEDTILFYGHFSNRTSTDDDISSLQYNMSIAYAASAILYFGISLVTMVRYTAKGVQQKFSQEGGQFCHYFNQVFCGWDYMLTKKKAADFKKINIKQNLMSDLEEERIKARQRERSQSEICKLYSVRVVINLLVLAVWAGCGYCIFKVTDTTVNLIQNQRVENNNFLMLLVQFLPSFTITILNIVVPLGLQQLVKFEGYRPAMEIKITISRTVFLRLASVFVLVISLRGQIVSCPDEDKTCSNCQDNVGLCWETFVGQQFYRLVILDFIVVIAVTLFVELPRKLLVERFPENPLFKFVGVQEFEIPKNVLDLVYTQTLCWIGAFYSPLIPAVTVLKLFIFFYIKKISLMHLSVLPARPYRASISTFFMTILMFSFILCVIPVLYSIGRISPSQGCGAFRVHSRDDYTMYTHVRDVLAHWPTFLRQVVEFFGSWTFYVPAVVIAGLCIYYYIAVIAGSKRLVRVLKDQLILDGRDKQYLLRQVRIALHHSELKQD